MISPCLYIIFVALRDTFFLVGTGFLTVCIVFLEALETLDLVAAKERGATLNPKITITKIVRNLIFIANQKQH